MCCSLTECQTDKLGTSQGQKNSPIDASFAAYNTRVSLSYLHAYVSRLKMCFTTVYAVFSQFAQLHSYYVPMCLHNHPLFRVTRAEFSRCFGSALCGVCSFIRRDAHRLNE